MKILNINLRTHDLPALWTFYTQVLGFKGEHLGTDAIQYRIGESYLTFSKAENDDHPYYHFAFNIPYRLYQEALAWLEGRVEVLKDENGNKLIDFTNWNAKAIYFFDPVGNIVEFIVRKDLTDHTQGSFNIEKVLSVSEIGIPVNDVLKTYEQIKKTSGVPPYKNNSPTFLPAGNEHGLFIIVDQAEKTWYPTNKKALSFPLFIEFEQEGEIYSILSNEGKLAVQ